MTYYEELGIRQDAPIEEIRQAYKTLARLLHPDVQADERVRAMAERQMKRLNELLATLADPEKRREYDEGLAGRERAAGESGRAARKMARMDAVYESAAVQFGRRHWFWLLIGLVTCGVGTWYAAQEDPAAEVARTATVLEGGKTEGGGRAEERREAVSGARKSGGETRATGRVGQAEAGRKAQQENASPGWTNEIAAPGGAEPRVEATARAGTTAEGKEVRDEAEEKEKAKEKEATLAGEWLYVPETGEKSDRSLYPATYVEFLVREENGNVSGEYRAKYTVPDQAIPGEVRFRAQGRSGNGRSATLEWTSGEGAKGEAEATLRGPNQMAVRWWTTEFGRGKGLSSGTAVLTRQEGR